ncbi:MAG: bifunctional riboflavin kinase/FAD synthetase [Nitrospinae bacterium]|nr:bifunctional riboflavin kinase/FAD synthetase [Nitrospinota bacterium]
MSKAMRVARGAAELRGAFGCAVATVGNFDGVHRGHREILQRVKGAAGRTGCASLLITFEPHPASVLYPTRDISLLTRTEKKLAILEELGLDAVLLQEFSLKFAQQDPRDFVSEVLLPLNVRELYVGHDFAFGRGRAGDAAFLMKEGERFGFSVFEVAQVSLEGDRVGSSRIRSLIVKGEVEQAARLLARHHSVTGPVVKGAGRGAQIGYPTCNLDEPEETVPGPGVYATRTLWNGRWYGSATHVGIVPTFNIDQPSIESFLFDFDGGDIHGHTIEVAFVKKLRDTVKYGSVEALVRQIKADCEAARETLKERP